MPEEPKYTRRDIDLARRDGAAEERERIIDLLARDWYLKHINDAAQTFWRREDIALLLEPDE